MTDNFDRIWKVSEEDILAVVWDDTEIFSQQHCEEVLLCRSLIPPGRPKAASAFWLAWGNAGLLRSR